MFFYTIFVQYGQRWDVDLYLFLETYKMERIFELVKKDQYLLSSWLIISYSMTLDEGALIADNMKFPLGR